MRRIKNDHVFIFPRVVLPPLVIEPHFADKTTCPKCDFGGTATHQHRGRRVGCCEKHCTYKRRKPLLPAYRSERQKARERRERRERMIAALRRAWALDEQGEKR